MRSQRRRQRPPDWPTLTARLDDLCRERGVLTRGGRPNYKQLAVACGVNHGLLLAWRRREQWPNRASVAAVARYAGQPLGPWLQAAGLDATADDSGD